MLNANHYARMHAINHWRYKDKDEKKKKKRNHAVDNVDALKVNVIILLNIYKLWILKINVENMLKKGAQLAIQ